LGLRDDELLTHEGMSDSGSFNEMVEALAFSGGLECLEDILAIMIPPANRENAFYRFWSRAMEPWDGPALVVFSDGRKIGARLDRNGFRPCRWARTETHFYLASEAGAFEIAEAAILQKGTPDATLRSTSRPGNFPSAIRANRRRILRRSLTQGSKRCRIAILTTIKPGV
jgi:hypothetical protein